MATRSELEYIAWAPYDEIPNPTREDWQRSYDALVKLTEIDPEDGRYPNTLGYLCYYGRHTGKQNYEEARKWFEKGHELQMIESTYKLADMLSGGLGGPEDKDRALRLYLHMYFWCREEFESGIKESKFADTALRMGRMFHEGKIVKKNDMEALSYLLEAKYAIDWRKQYCEYGDETVEKNILRLIDECDKPDEEVQNWSQFRLGLGMVPDHLITEDTRMTIDIEVDDQGVARLEFRRKRTDGKKPNRILWPIAPAMKCLMTDSVVLYGAEIRRIWQKSPGETVLCDRYEYDKDKETYEFYLGEELQCTLQGGFYVLPMDEFWKTEMRDHPESPTEQKQ